MAFGYFFANFRVSYFKYSHFRCSSVIFWLSNKHRVSQMCFLFSYFQYNHYLKSTTYQTSIILFHEQNHFLFQMRKNLVNGQWRKMQKLLLSWQNLAVCLKRKTNLVLIKCVMFFLGFVFSRYHIDSDFHLFRLILLEASFFRTGFPAFVSSL